MCFDGESPDFCEHEIIKKSRKEHQCYECRNIIAKGDSYEKYIGSWDGEFQTYKICAPCSELREKIQKLELSHGCGHEESFVPFGCLLEAARDYRAEITGKEPAKS